ncbi:hypothetical protein DV735_g4515, partial [Chaetothyriales sp. CBS 134920]
MLMARTSHANEFQGGSLPAKRPQLPSFSNFLSGVQDAPPPSLPHNNQDNRPSRPDLFSSISLFAQPKQQSPGSSSSRLYPDEHFSAPPPPPVFPAGRHSPSRSDSQPRAQFPCTPPGQTQDENVSLQEASVPGLAHNDGSRTKTVLREEYVHGKGVCYVYDDGSLCPKAINGHVVNPKWGTTKAGKPRKRLGQACNTCREKKIRCEPQVPKCSQCQKFGRECKFETGKASQKGAPSSPVTPEPQKDSLGDLQPSSPSAETPSEQNAPSYRTASKRRTLSVAMDRSPVHQAPSLPAQGTLSKMENDAKPVPRFSASVDPFAVDERLTSHYVRKAINNCNDLMFHVVPTTIFLKLTSVDESRPLGARAVLYAMMGFSATYSGEDLSSPEGWSRSFAQIAQDCLDEEGRQPSCFDVLANLILSFQANSEGNQLKAKQLNQKSFEICYKLGINSEEGLEQLLAESGPWFNLPPALAKESMRRLFWISYVASGFHGYTNGDIGNRTRLECALQMPCDDACYESGKIPSLPIFRCTASERQEWTALPGHGPIAYLVELSMILNDATDILGRVALQRPPEFESFVGRAKARLLVLDRALRIKFSDSPQARISTRSSGMRAPSGNMRSSGTCGIHLLYHFVAMVQNRYVAWQTFSREAVDRCVRDTFNHAVQTMDLLNRLDIDDRSMMHHAEMTRSSPIAALAVLAAIDVITAAGPISDIFEHQDEGGEHGLKKMVTCALEVLEEHSEHWQQAETLSDLVKERLKHLLSLRHGQILSQKAFFFRTPLHSPYGLDLDVVYGLPHPRYFNALGWGGLFLQNMSSKSLTTTTAASSPLPSRPFSSSSGLGTAVPLRTPIAKPSPGTFRHPYMSEVVRRQSKAVISAGSVNNAALNAGALFLIAVFYQTLRHSLSLALRLTPLEPDSATSLASYTLYGLILLFAANILLSLRPLLPFAKPASYDDIPLTPSQRHLLGLPPSNAATPQSNSRGGSSNSNAPSPFITPPRYTRRLSSSGGTTATGRFSMLGNYSPSPLSSPRHALSFGSPANGSSSAGAPLGRTTSASPFSPGLSSSNAIAGSPLFHKAVQLSQDRSAEPGFDISTSTPVFGLADSSLARSTSLRDWSPSRRRNAGAADVADREQRSPAQKGVNYKWMYDKGF